MKTEDAQDYTLTYDDSPEAKERVYDIMLKHFRELRAFNGDSIGGGNDEVYITAPDILTECAEKGFQFNQKWKE